MLKRFSPIFVAIAVSILNPSFAMAHGEVVSTSPAQDATVLTAPTEVSIEFDGKLQTLDTAGVNSITVTDNQGQIISDQHSIVVGPKISTKLLLTDITGLVSVHYRIVSEDGHPVEGDYSFNVGQVPTLTSSQGEENAETRAGVSEESGSNLLVTGSVALVVIGFAFFMVRRFKK